MATEIKQPIEAEIVHQTEALAPPPSPQVSLGSLAIRNPKDLVTKATEMADALSQIIVKQNLYKQINGRKYVLCEGWTTLGAMMGVVPVEEYCRPLSGDDGGFEAKVRLIRAHDGGQVGGASAECTRDENNWEKRDSYALRSMAITRATGKAFRLSFSWIMKLAGFEPTPAEEMMGQGSKEEAKEVASKKLRKHAKDKGDDTAILLTEYGEGTLSVSGTAGLAILKAEVDPNELKAFGFGKDGNVLTIPALKAWALQDMCEKVKVPVHWAESAKKQVGK